LLVMNTGKDAVPRFAFLGSSSRGQCGGVSSHFPPFVSRSARSMPARDRLIYVYRVHRDLHRRR
jgi:hypothetical protein